METEEPPPTLQDFMEEFEADIPRVEPAVLPALTGKDFAQALARRPAYKADGFCGWSSRERKALTMHHCNIAADMFNTIEQNEGAVLPEAMRYIPKVTLVKKGHGPTAGHQPDRPELGVAQRL